MSDNTEVVMIEERRALQPSNQELAELAAVISSRGTNLNPEQVKITWLYAAKRGLDVISGQLIPVILRGRLTFITSIDGFRVIAERSGDYAGQDPIRFEQSESTGKLEWAEATVYRHSWGDRGLTVRVWWDEFCPESGKDFTWRKMPHVMLGKVAEAHALRKAFPNDMSGMYSDDEMEQAGVQQKPERPQPATVAEAQDADAEGPVREEATVVEGVIEVEPPKRTNHEDPDPEPEPKRTYIRRQKGEADEAWAERLAAQGDNVSDSQAKWLDGYMAQAQPPAENGDLTEQASEVFDDMMADADVDPSRGGSSDPAEMQQPKWMELPVFQGNPDDAWTDVGTVGHTEMVTTPKGNKVLTLWVFDSEQRYKAVMAGPLAETSHADRLVVGQVIRVRGAWTQLGDEVLVLASSLQAESA